MNETPTCNDTAVSPAEMARLVSMRVGDRIMYRGQLCEVMAQRQDGTYVVTPVLQAALLQAAQRRPRNRKERRAAAARERRA